MLERPQSFIRDVIDSLWTTTQPAPPFPSYPSGHAMIGMAAAEVLTSIYGDNYEMTDFSHFQQKGFKGTPRHFTSFDQMARENAASRVLMGVHFRFDCEEGLRLGKEIAHEIVGIPIKLTDTSLPLP
jgi:hypothetical protein